MVWRATSAECPSVTDWRKLKIRQLLKIAELPTCCVIHYRWKSATYLFYLSFSPNTDQSGPETSSKIWYSDHRWFEPGFMRENYSISLTFSLLLLIFCRVALVELLEPGLFAPPFICEWDTACDGGEGEGEGEGELEFSLSLLPLLASWSPPSGFTISCRPDLVLLIFIFKLLSQSALS